ncbi:MAG TPA: alcohol dehydrogenase catalytic domain-containing protein [Novosphingobium sp.]|nr:alcohol dehydrogenase catalytic domain-containing protein [Novosphingobium sp.]
MKAAIYPGSGKPIVIENLPDPRPGPNELLIKVHRCGVCGTDLSMTKGTAWDFGTNVQFGHEYAGEVVEAGSAVSGWRPSCPRLPAGTADRAANMATTCCARPLRPRR